VDDTSRSLLERVRDSANAESWRRLVDLYTPWLHGWLRRCQIPDADRDDFVQEVLVVVANEVGEFELGERRGAFRNWLRTILFNRLRHYWRQQQTRPLIGAADILTTLEDPRGEFDQIWDREHDEYVTRRLLDLIEPEFMPATWRAFRRQVVDECSASSVADELGLTANAVLIAKSRVLRRLREEARGLTD
jgi:RNA polymerase sigma-70 factor (ECF subfamily)